MVKNIDNYYENRKLVHNSISNDEKQVLPNNVE